MRRFGWIVLCAGFLAGCGAQPEEPPELREQQTLPVIEVEQALPVMSDVEQEVPAVDAGPEPSVSTDWTLLLPHGHARFSPRDSAGALVFHETLYLFGGYHPAGDLADVVASTDGVHWEYRATLPCPTATTHPVQFVMDQQMFVTCTDGALVASADGLAWTRIMDQVPWSAFNRSAGVVYRGHVYVVAGGQPTGGAMPSIIWGSRNGTEWDIVLAETPWNLREVFGGLLVLHDVLYYVSGGTRLGSPGEVWRSGDAHHWELLTGTAPWPARIWEAYAVFQDRLWLVGGYRLLQGVHTNLNDIWTFDGHTWAEVPQSDSIWTPRHAPAVFVLHDALYLVGGNTYPVVNDVWRLTSTEEAIPMPQTTR